MVQQASPEGAGEAALVQGAPVQLSSCRGVCQQLRKSTRGTFLKDFATEEGSNKVAMLSNVWKSS